MKPEDKVTADRLAAAGTTQTPLTADQLIADGWKEYPDQFRKYARMFCKYFPTPTRCFLNDDKPGLQVCLYLSEWESRISVEMEVCSGLSDGTWIKIHNYSLPNTLPEVLALIPMILGIWEHAANGKSALAASRAREAELADATALLNGSRQYAQLQARLAGAAERAAVSQQERAERAEAKLAEQSAALDACKGVLLELRPKTMVLRRDRWDGNELVTTGETQRIDAALAQIEALAGGKGQS